MALQTLALRDCEMQRAKVYRRHQHRQEASRAFVVLLLLGSGCANEPNLTIKVEDASKLHRIAILDFVDAPGADAGHSGRVVAGVVAKAALAVPGWQILERKRLDHILAEQDLQATNIVDTASAVRIGKIVGADGIVVGEVARYRIGSIPFLFLVTLDQDVYKIEYGLRLVSVETSEVCLSAHISNEHLVSFDAAISEPTAELFQRIAAELGRLQTSTSAPSPNEFNSPDRPR